MVTMNTNEIKIGQVAVTGRVSGLWNKENKSFDVKRGQSKSGKKYQIFEISVASKDKESGEWTNGKGLKVMLWGDTKVEHGGEIGVVGRLQPDNWTNHEGKEIWGNMLNAFADDLFEPASWEPKESSGKPQEEKKEEEVPEW